jgi:uncharacterized protein YbbC (DUF1343 family)
MGLNMTLRTGILFFILCLYTSRLQAQTTLKVGAEQMDMYLPKIENKKVGMVVNHTAVVGSTHLVDTLLTKGVQIKGIYAPEHGYKGNVERGKTVATTKDTLTGITVYSIYGSRKKPSAEDLKEIEVMIFDMQDVGVRFFTYISTLHYIMEACAENNLPLLLLDRPNPIGYYVDGPVLDPAFKSFIGMHPIPIAHGMTIGEYAQMINGEGWLKNGVKCQLEVIKAANYTHKTLYQVPVRPSPNLPDMKSIYLYPSICLFEGTQVSEGRGTYKPFQQFGTPEYTPKKHSFVPQDIPSLSINPKFEGKTCYGYDLSAMSLAQLQDIKELKLNYLLEFYKKAPDKEKFFTKSFEQLAGSDNLRKQIIAGKTEKEIRESWKPGLEKFKQVRKKYLLYQE